MRPAPTTTFRPAGEEQCEFCGSRRARADADHSCAAAWREQLTDRFVIRDTLREGRRSATFTGRSVDGGPVMVIHVVARLRGGDTRDVDAFRQSAESVRTLNHPQIVPLLDYGAAEHFVWFATEHIKSASLAARLRGGGPLEFPECARVVAQVAGALDHAHRRGVVHGSLTPGNVLLDAAGWVRVTDFALREALAIAGNNPLMGDPSPYLAPEQLGLARVSAAAADQWALAVLTYECLAGITPFGDRTPLEIARGRTPPPLADLHPGLPPHLDEVIQRALAPRAAFRFDGVLEFSTALERGAPPPLWNAWDRQTADPATHVLMPEPAPRRWTAGLVIATAAVGIAASSWWAWESRGELLQRIRGAPPADTAVAPIAPPPQPVRRAELPRPDTDEPTTLNRPEPARASRPSVPAASNPASVRPPARVLPPPSRTPAPVRSPVLDPGLLIVNSRPWGQVYVDGNLVGNTPIAGIRLPAGPHRVRIIRAGFEAFDQTVTVPAAGELRLTGIALKELR
jgi:serine/threonine-protein kinase